MRRRPEPSFPSRPTLELSFDRAGRTGRVRVRYGTTRRASDSGFAAIRGFSAPDSGAGFPTIKAEVETDQHGYLNDLGWIQWVHQKFPGRRRSTQIVDRFQSMLDLDCPFATLGYAPTFFDAPAWPLRPAVRWSAILFLTTVPIMSRREPILPLAGFDWGYDIAERGALPVPRSVVPARPANWRTIREEVGRAHPRWRFAARYVAPARRVTSRSRVVSKRTRVSARRRSASTSPAERFGRAAG